MRHSCRRIGWRRQNGAVAVEAAVTIALILVPLLTFILLFGRYFWYYTAAQKAVHDATFSISSLPIADIRAGRAEDLAARIIEWETADFDETTRSTKAPAVDCWYRFPATARDLSRFNCSTAGLTPVVVRTSLTMMVNDPFLSPVMSNGGLLIVTEMTMRYVER
ncbi:MAG: hypothetical protein V7631_2485 [Massilia sp.]|jgi:Flp pilus assembly protein TadG